MRREAPEDQESGLELLVFARNPRSALQACLVICFKLGPFLVSLRSLPHTLNIVDNSKYVNRSLLSNYFVGHLRGKYRCDEHPTSPLKSDGSDGWDVFNIQIRSGARVVRVLTRRSEQGAVGNRYVPKSLPVVTGHRLPTGRGTILYKIPFESIESVLLRA